METGGSTLIKSYKYIFLTLLFLAGCTTADKVQDPYLLAETHGYILIHFPRAHPGIEIKDIESDRTYSLKIDYLNKTSGLWVRKGSYKLSKAFYGVGGNELKGYPTIEVKAGQITSLGSLINFNLGEDKNIWMQKSFSITKDLESQYVSRFKQNLVGAKLNKWELTKIPEVSTTNRLSSGQGLIVDWLLAYSDSNQEGRLKKKLLNETSLESFYQTALKTLPPLARQDPAIDVEGNLYYGAELGQIKKRSPDGIWTTIDTGTLEPISKVYWHKGQLIAANRSKWLSRSLDSGKTWKLISTFAPEELILDIDAHNDRLYILTSQKSDAAYAEGKGFVVTIYGTSAHDFRNVETIKYIPHKGVILRDPKAEIANGYYFVGFEPNVLKSMSLKTEQWDDIPLPQDFSTYNIAEDGLISLFNIQGIFSDLFISEDKGESWHELKPPSYVIENIFFSSKDIGVSHRTEMNAFSASYFVQRYEPLKGGWVNISKAPDECKYLIEDDKRQARFCVTKSDEVLVLTDNKWISEVIM